jgi:hypothetical protein
MGRREHALLLATASLLLSAETRATQAEPRVLHKEIVVAAPLAAVWHAWTTAADPR